MMMKVSAGDPRCMMVSAMRSELSMGEKRAKAMCAAMRKTAEVSAMLMVAARCLPLRRSHHPIAGPRRKAVAASEAGRRSAAKEGPVRSKKCDIERV